MKNKYANGKKEVLSIILFAFLVLPVFGQTEEQKKHPKYSELDSHYQAYNKATQTGNYKTALSEIKKTLELSKELFGEEDSTTGTFYKELGFVYRMEEDSTKAIEAYQNSLRIKLKALGEEHSELIEIYHTLAAIFQTKGEYDQAIENYEKSSFVKRKTLGENHIETGMSYGFTATIYKSKKDYTKAIEFYKKKLSILITALGKNHPDVDWTCIQIGETYEQNREYEQAVEYYLKSLAIRLETLKENHPDIMTLYFKIADGYAKYSENDKSLDYYKKGLAISSLNPGGDNIDIAKIYNKIGHLYGHRDYDKFIEYQTKALTIYLKILGENNSDTAITYYIIGYAYHKKRDFNKATGFYLKYLEINVKIFGESHEKLGKVYFDLGKFYHAQENFDKAIEYYHKDLNIALKKFEGGDNMDAVWAYENLGSVYMEIGEYEKAIEYFRKALNYNSKGPATFYRHYVSKNYNSLGSAYSHKGDFDKAIEYYTKALEIDLELVGDNHDITADTYNNLGVAYSEKGDYDKALEYHNKAIAIREKILGENNLDIATSYNNLGVVYSHKGEYDKALEYHNKSLAIELKFLGENHSKIATGYHNLGAVYADKKEYDKAIEYYSKAISISEKFTNVYSHLITYQNLKVVYRNQKNIEKQISVLREIIGLVLKYRQRMGRDKDFFTRRFISEFEELIELYKEQGDFEKAFEISEKMRGLSVMENMNLKSALKESNIPKEKADTLLQLQGKIESLYSQKSLAESKGEKGKSDMEMISRAILNNEKEFFELDKEFSKNPIYASLRKIEIPNIKNLQKELKKENKTFLEYNLVYDKEGWANLYVFVISPDHFELVSLGKKIDITRRIENLRKILSEYPDKRKFILVKDILERDVICAYGSGNGECQRFEKGKGFFVEEVNYNKSKKDREGIVYEIYYKGVHERKIDVEEANQIMDKLLHEIYDLTIQPLKKKGLLKTNSIVISPDNKLYGIPFAALKNQKNEYLLEEFNLSLIHSAAIWEKLGKKTKIEYTKPFFAMGHSVYSSGHNDTRSTRGQRGLKSINQNTRSIRGISNLEELKMNNLPGSLEEIAEVSKMAYDALPPEHIFLGIRANKDELYEKFTGEKKENYRSVLFSAHGLFFTDSPSLNSLAFTSRKKAEAFRVNDLKEYESKHGELKRDGFLKLGETIELGIKTDLIVMSACETSLGTDTAGDGMVGLPQGFLIGGANNVLATLWSVDDKGTMNFMKEFYSPFFKKNFSATKSLRTAQKILSTKNSKNNKYADPFYWSPFVVYGR